MSKPRGNLQFVVRFFFLLPPLENLRSGQMVSALLFRRITLSLMVKESLRGCWAFFEKSFNTKYYFTKFNWTLQWDHCNCYRVKYDWGESLILSHDDSVAVHSPTIKQEHCLKTNREEKLWRGVGSEFLQEAQNQVSERGAQRLVVVTNDVRPVLLQLDQRVVSLQVQDVSVRRLLHFHLWDPVLQMRTCRQTFHTRRVLLSWFSKMDACRCLNKKCRSKVYVCAKIY